MATQVKAALDLETHSSELIDQVQNERSIRIALSDDGRIVAGLVSPQDLKRLERLDDEHDRGWARLREISEQYFSGVSSEELMDEALKAQKEGRQEAREARHGLSAAH